MTQEQKAKYNTPDDLRAFLKSLKGMKFQLDCGHHVTFGHHMANDITIRHSYDRIVCSQCGYEGN